MRAIARIFFLFIIFCVCFEFLLQKQTVIFKKMHKKYAERKRSFSVGMITGVIFTDFVCFVKRKSAESNSTFLYGGMNKCQNR